MANILLCGIPSEPPLALAARELDRLGVSYLLFNQREFRQVACEFLLSDAGISGMLSINGETFALEEIHAVYTRLTDFRLLPELRGFDIDSPDYAHCRFLHETIAQWYEIAPGRVVNRFRSNGSNSSKPYQSQIIGKYFLIPETLVTNKREEVVAFREKHERIIYKSISGIRSIVQTFSDDDYDRLGLLRWCPVQFQQFVGGIDVRVHVVGERTFATVIQSDGTDYRYAHHQGHEPVKMEATTLPPALEDSCVRLSRELGLGFSGIDLRIADDGSVYCFEVNPSPGYSSYEESTNQPIARALARYLAYLD